MAEFKTYDTLNSEMNEINAKNLVIMEKDKEIITLSKLSDDLMNQIDSLKKEVQTKDYELLSIKADFTSLSSDNRIYEKKIAQLNDKVDFLTSQLNNKKEEIFSQKENTESQLKEITQAFNTHMKDYETIVGQSQNFEKEIVKLSNDLIEKDNTINSYQQMLFELKRDNKRLLQLNDTIQEKEDIISSLTEQLEEEKKKNMLLANENNEINSRYNYVMKGNGSYYELDNSRIKPSINELITNLQIKFKRDIEEKDKAYYDLKATHNSLVRENEKSIKFLIEQIKLLEACVENNSTSPIMNSIDKNSINTKNELIRKNFELLAKKIIQIRKNDFETIDTYRLISDKEKEKTKLIQKQLEEEKKNRQNERKDIINIDKLISDKQRELEKINNKLVELSEVNDKIIKENEAIQIQATSQKKDFEDFCDAFISSLSSFYNGCQNFPFANLPQFSILDDIEVKKDKIIQSLSTLFSHINYITDSCSKTNEIMMNIQNEKNNIKAELEEKKKNETISNSIEDNQKLTYVKEEENKNLTNKIKEISALLQDSNKCLEECNEENKKLLEKNKRLEYNLEMLTKSHYEMENNINMNEQISQEKVDSSQRKCNHLLQELEIKNIQINSLEKLVEQLSNRDNKRQSQRKTASTLSEYKGKLVKRGKSNELKNLLNKSKSNNFLINDKSERELNNYLSKFSSEYILPRNTNNIQSHSNNNSFNDTLSLTNNDLSIRTAPVGKIFRAKGM